MLFPRFTPQVVREATLGIQGHQPFPWLPAVVQVVMQNQNYQ